MVSPSPSYIAYQKLYGRFIMSAYLKMALYATYKDVFQGS